MLNRYFKHPQNKILKIFLAYLFLYFKSVFKNILFYFIFFLFQNNFFYVFILFIYTNIFLKNKNIILI
jgi:hypothetical protein